MDTQNIIRKFDLALADPKIYSDTFKMAAEEGIESIRFRAISGEAEAAIFMREKLCRFIYMNPELDTLSIADFDDPEKNSSYIRLLMLIESAELSDIIRDYCREGDLDESVLDLAFKRYREDICRRFPGIRERTEMLARIIFSEVYGLGPVDFLRKRRINEIGVLRCDYIYVISGGRKTRIRVAGYENPETLRNVLKKATMVSNMPFDRSNPISISSRKNTDRVAAAGYDVTPDDSEQYMNVRIFNLESITLEELRDSYHTLDDTVLGFLEINMKGKGSFFVTGADMNVGKSTLLLALLEKLPARFGLGIIDPQNEMRISVRYPDKNTITLISNELKSTDECFEYLLKTSRDVIAVSEITNSNEATQLINGALRLNCGICATMHSLNPSEALTNLRNLMMRTDMYSNEHVAEEDIKRGIDLIVHLKRLGERIVIESVSELTADGVCEIFCFEQDSWVRKGKPSQRYMKKISGYISEEDIDELGRIFYD